MPSITPTVSNATPTAATQAENKASQMGKDDFLKVFVAQMSHQDPSKPMDDTAFMGQMASFSTLEQISNMAKANGLVADNLAQSNSISLIGRTVTYADEAGALHTGKVEKVTTAGGESLLTVDGVEKVSPAWVSQVS
jgi:flagellar basal-body rod modification protein FlgD